MAQLYDFLVEAELQQYYTNLTAKLNVVNVSDIKHAEDEELAGIGMTRPEIRRLKKFTKKHSQPKALNKLKRILTKSQEESKSSSFDENALSGRSPPGTRLRTSRLIEQSAVTVSCKLGAGEFGTVHYGVWKREDNTKLQVAVKTLTKSVMKENGENFLEEIATMHCLDHIHVAKLYGVVIDEQMVMMVTELAPMKSLVDCLRDPGNRAYFSVAVLCDLAIQIADGMSYLESQAFVHRDLAARNILVFSKDVVKICDHGLTRALGVGLDYYQMNVSINLKLPIAWCAPECISGGNFTSASDVWSFGVTLWEMFSYGFQPWAGFTGSQIASAIGQDEGQRLDQPERCPKEFYDLMLLCWSHQPSRRPCFSKLVEGMPQMKATQHIVCKESTSCRSDCLSYCVGDIITFLDRSCPISGFWKGIHEPSNKVGLFCTADTLPYVESKVSSVILRKGKVNRKESDRKSLRPGQRLHAGMISVPQNDLRHMGHVGHDGVMFGDVACLEEKQEKLLSKDIRPGDDICGSSISLPVSVHSSKITRSCSNSSLVSDVTSVVTSIISSDTLTDVSSMQEDIDSLPKSLSEEALDDSFQYDSPNEDLEDFKIPDISNSFDLGPSLMDEVMKAFGGSKDERPSSTKMKTKAENFGRDEAVEQSFKTSRFAASGVGDVDRTITVRRIAATEHPSPYQNGQNASSIPQKNAFDKQENIQNEVLEEKLKIMAITTDSVDSLTVVGLEQKSINPAAESIKELMTVHPNITGRGYSPKTESKLPHHSPPTAAGRAQQFRREQDAVAASSHLSDSRGSLKNGVLSKIGSALARKSSNLEHKMLQSLDLRRSPPASISSSSEFLPGVRKLSSTSSSSLPVRNGAYPSLVSHVSSTGLAMDEEEAGLSAVRRLRPGRSFTKTTEKIRSSVVSVIRNRGSQKNARPPPQPNLNANLLFFDRLREQELERAQLENPSQADEVNFVEKKPSNGLSRNDLHPEQLNSTNGSSSSRHHEALGSVAAVASAPSHTSAALMPSDDIQPHPSSVNLPTSSEVVLRSKKQGSGCMTTGESFVTDRCPSVISRDSLHISDCSSLSLTRQSTGSNSTDDSGTTSLDGCVVQVSSSDCDWRANGFPRSISKEPLQVNVWNRKTGVATSSPPRGHAKPSSFSESERNDDHNQTFRMFDGGLRSNSEDNEQVLLLSPLVAAVPREDCLYALSETDGNVNPAACLRNVQRQAGTRWEDRNLEHYKRAVDACDWDSSARFNCVMEQPSSGRESPELVHV